MPSVHWNPQSQTWAADLATHRPYAVHRLHHGTDLLFGAVTEKPPVSLSDDDTTQLKSSPFFTDIHRIGDLRLCLRGETLIDLPQHTTQWPEDSGEKAEAIKQNLSAANQRYQYEGIEVLGLLFAQWNQGMKADISAALPLCCQLNGTSFNKSFFAEIDWHPESQRLLIRTHCLAFPPNGGPAICGVYQPLEFRIDNEGEHPALQLVRKGETPPPLLLTDSGEITFSVMDPALEDLLRSKLKSRRIVHSAFGTSTITWGHIRAPKPQPHPLWQPVLLLSLSMAVASSLMTTGIIAVSPAVATSLFISSFAALLISAWLKRPHRPAAMPALANYNVIEEEGFCTMISLANTPPKPRPRGAFRCIKRAAPPSRTPPPSLRSNPHSSP